MAALPAHARELSGGRDAGAARRSGDAGRGHHRLRRRRPHVRALEGAFAEAASAKGLELACLVEDAVPYGLGGDPVRLREVLNHVLGNAVKFTSEGTVVLRASLAGAGPTEAVVRFDVTDTGIGVPPEAQYRQIRP